MAKKKRDSRARRGRSRGATDRTSVSRKTTSPRKGVAPGQRRRVRIRGAAPRTAVSSLEDLLRHTRRELIEYARAVGLEGLTRLTKGALAARYLQALERIAGPTDSPRPADAPPSVDPGLEPVEASEAKQIPWGYGQDRVTAMVVDPERLYV